MDFADRHQLTPLFAELARTKNSLRAAKIAAAYEEIAGLFDHVVLKGFTHVPDFVEDFRLRTQYDLDLYVPDGERDIAWKKLLTIGYEPIEELEGLAADHLPTLVRKTNWEWRGDYFDPEIPVSIEVHFQFWDMKTDRLRADGIENFWARRQDNSLHPVDKLGYAALHLTRHLFRGHVRAFHAWELARFLHTRHDQDFWRTWRELHSPSLRRMEAVAFLLARTWFACDLSPEAASEVAALPDKVRRWFEKYGWSPLDPQPNKHELALQLALIEPIGDRLRVLRRKLLPSTLPGPVDAVHVPEDRMTLFRRLKKQSRYVAYLGSRALFHLRLLVPTLLQNIRER